MSSQVIYPEPIEGAVAKIEAVLSNYSNGGQGYHLSRRSIALLLLQKDPDFWQEIPTAQQPEIELAIAAAQAELGEPITSAIARTRQQVAWNLEKQVLSEPSSQQKLLTDWLHQVVVNPITGFPLLLLILYYGVYKFVGEFGAGTLVDLIETFFEERINPLVNHITALVIPWEPIQDLIANDYGIITLGVRYATAIVLPVVCTFFFMFSLLEDSGYLPRLSLMLDRVFKFIGLSGRAVIPIVLGFG
jgi:ferrous iron transport protein B